MIVGKIQAKALAQRFKGKKLEFIATSSHQRALQTAEIIAEHHQQSPILQFDELQEMDYGIFEGKSFDPHAPDSVFEALRGIVKLWDNGIDEPIPGGERPSDVEKRAVPTIHSLVQRMNQPNSMGLIVCHGRLLRIVLCRLLKLDWSQMAFIQQHNTAVNLLEWKGDHFEAIYLNDTSHLQQNNIQFTSSFLNPNDKMQQKSKSGDQQNKKPHNQTSKL